jgi:hypothetical protein
MRIRRRQACTGILSILVVLTCCPATWGSEKEQKKVFADYYKGKFVVVLREGLAVGICARQRVAGPLTGHQMAVPLAVRISGKTADYKTSAGVAAGLLGCDEIVPEPVHKGEVLQVKDIHLSKRGMGMVVDTVSPHQISRGVGAFAHQTYEQGEASLGFMDCGGPTEECQAQIEKWLKVFETQDEAAKFGNTASGVFVKQVKLGMTFAEVESVLGPPSTRVDLGEKVLYKYQDMTVEFRDGKVADVR